jgi:hypothetical protein
MLAIGGLGTVKRQESELGGRRRPGRLVRKLGTGWFVLPLAVVAGAGVWLSLPAVLGNSAPAARSGAAAEMGLAAGEGTAQVRVLPTPSILSVAPRRTTARQQPTPHSGALPLLSDTARERTTGTTTTPAKHRASSASGASTVSGASAARASATKPKPRTSTKPTATGRVVRAYVTAYTWYDNDPPGGAIANPVLHRTAGGTGTYANPITLAVAGGAFRPGVRMYIADLRRYFIVEDTCASCGQLPVWIDMWLDGRSGTAASTQACAERLTRYYSVIVGAGPGLPVSAGSLYGAKGCYR